MSTHLESIDKLPYVMPDARVNKSDKTKATDDKESFKRTLKRKMQQNDDEQDDDNTTHDILELTEENDSEIEEREQVASLTDEERTDEDEMDENEETGIAGHIDLKA